MSPSHGHHALLPASQVPRSPRRYPAALHTQRGLSQPHALPSPGDTATLRGRWGPQAGGGGRTLPARAPSASLSPALTAAPRPTRAPRCARTGLPAATPPSSSSDGETQRAEGSAKGARGEVPSSTMELESKVVKIQM